METIKYNPQYGGKKDNNPTQLKTLNLMLVYIYNNGELPLDGKLWSTKRMTQKVIGTYQNNNKKSGTLPAGIKSYIPEFKRKFNKLLNMSHCDKAKRQFEYMLNHYNAGKCSEVINGKKCGKRAEYGLPGWGMWKRWCNRCSKNHDGAQQLRIRCKCIKCGIHNAYYIEEDSNIKNAKYCGTCRDIIMSESNIVLIQANRKLCDECGRKEPFYSAEQNGKATHCTTCGKNKNMYLVRKKVCVDCELYDPAYNYEGDPSRYCKSCAEKRSINGKRMIYVVRARCINGCTGLAAYAKAHGDKPMYCGPCGRKLDYMDVVNTRCKQIGCYKRPIFNYPGCKSGCRCRVHCLLGMIDVIHKKCEVCGTTASYGYINDKGKKVLLRCFKHSDQYEDIKNPKCTKCDISYASWGIKSRTHCGECAERDIMRNMSRTECEHEMCGKAARYGTIYKPKQYCAEHGHEHGAYLVTFCIECPGRTRPNPACYSDNSYEAKWCEECGNKNHLEHEDYQMVLGNVELHECNSCNKSFPLLNKDGKCDYCRKPEKVFENAVVNYIKQVFPNNIISIDTRVANSRSLYRPDILMQFNDYYIIIEVDEYQHKRCNVDDEINRMYELHAALKHTPTLFVRFNPNCYRINNALRRDSMMDRLICLKEYINSIDRVDDPLSATYMYYDNRKLTNVVMK